MRSRKRTGQKLSDVRIGISGWTYEPWREGVFYPKKFPQKLELEYASRCFNSIEVNGTFYALQRPHTFVNWYERTPADFRFALKAPQYVTHERRLKDVGTAVANFMLSGILGLKEKLGPLLWQLPPSLPFDAERVEAFFAQLPRTAGEALALEPKCSPWMGERMGRDAVAEQRLKHALEFRHASFMCDEFVALAKKYHVGIVICDVEPGKPYVEAPQTADFVYVRLHGAESLYPKGYTTPALKKWQKKMDTWSKAVAELYVFCNCDHKDAAPANGKTLMKLWYGEPYARAKNAALVEFSKAATHNRRVRKANGRGRAKN